MAAALMLESVRGVYVLRLSGGDAVGLPVGDAVGDAALHASEEDAPSGLERPGNKTKGRPNRTVTKSK